MVSILKNDGYENFLRESTPKLVSVLEERRSSGLESIEKTLKNADISTLTESELFNYAMDIQSSVVSQGSDALKIDEVMSGIQLDIAEEAREEAVSQWSLGLPLAYSDDSTLDLMARNNAGLFLLERDAQLRRRLAEIFARRYIGYKNLEKSASKPEKPAELFTRHWGSSAEKNYWGLVCSSWANKTRNHSIAASFNEAGMEKCMISAQIDERTTEICRFLNGKIISVSSVLERSSSLSTPTTTGGWFSTVPSQEEGEGDILVIPSKAAGEKPIPVAKRTDSFILGSLGPDMGSYEQYVSDEQLADIVGPPPYHFLCRTILIPVELGLTDEFRAKVENTEMPSGLGEYVDNYLEGQ